MAGCYLLGVGSNESSRRKKNLMHSELLAIPIYVIPVLVKSNGVIYDNQLTTLH